MNYFVTLLFISGFGYLTVVMILVYGFRRIRSGISEKKPFVSVVIAARNEKTSVSTCLTSLMRQNYKSELFEVIVVDDRSEDGTFDVLSHFRSVWNNLKIIKVDQVPEGVSPKKHAISKAIEIAGGEIILQTDADCVVPENWISGMVSRFEEGIDMVTGAAPYFHGSGVLNSFIRHEYLWNITLSAGSIALGHGTHASARNLGFRQKAFERAGGYGSMKTVISGDDTLLLHRIRKLKKNGVATIPDSSTHVYSKPPGDFMSFSRQRIRHMSTGKYFNPFLIGIGFVVYGYHILTVISLLLSFFSLHAFTVFFVSFLWKNIVDSIAFRRTETVFGLDIEWKRFIINEFFLLVYMAVLPVCGVFVPVRWKEK